MNTFMPLIATLGFLLAPLYGASPNDDETVEFPMEFAEVFNRMVKEGLEQSKSSNSAIHFAYKCMQENGIIEWGKKHKAVAKAMEYSKKVLDDNSVNTQREKVLQLIGQKSSLEERIASWTSLKEKSYIVLEEVLKKDISDLQLPADIAQTIDDNKQIKLSFEQRTAFWGVQLAIASGMEALYRRDRESFNSLFEQWLPKDTYGGCTIS